MLGYFNVSIIHRTLTWTTGSLTCVCDLFACVDTRGTSVYSLIRRTFVESAQDSGLLGSLSSCVKVEVAVLDSPVPNKPRGLCERKATLNQIKCSRSVPLSLPCGQLYVYTIGGQTGVCVCMCVRVYVRARARARVSVCVCVCVCVCYAL